MVAAFKPAEHPVNARDKAELAELVKELAVVRGKVILSSGKEADYYVDLRRVTMHSRASRLIGSLLRELTADWDYVAAGGLTLGADPVGTAIMRTAARLTLLLSVRKRKSTACSVRLKAPMWWVKRFLLLRTLLPLEIPH